MLNAKGKYCLSILQSVENVDIRSIQVGGYEQIQEPGSTKLLFYILENPSKFYTAVKCFTAETLMTLVYGKTFSTDGKDLKTLLHILETFIQDIHPARHLVDTFPVLDYLPNLLASRSYEETQGRS